MDDGTIEVTMVMPVRHNELTFTISERRIVDRLVCSVDGPVEEHWVAGILADVAAICLDACEREENEANALRSSMDRLIAIEATDHDWEGIEETAFDHLVNHVDCLHDQYVALGVI